MWTYHQGAWTLTIRKEAGGLFSLIAENANEPEKNKTFDSINSPGSAADRASVLFARFPAKHDGTDEAPPKDINAWTEIPD